MGRTLGVSASSLSASSSSLSAPSALTLDIKTVSRSNSHFSRDFDFESLDGLDIDDVLDSVEEKEQDLVKTSKQRLEKPRNVPDVTDEQNVDEDGYVFCVDAVSIRLSGSAWE